MVVSRTALQRVAKSVAGVMASSVILTACATAPAPSSYPDWSEKAVVDIRACRAEYIQLWRSGAPKDVVARKRDECDQIAIKDRREHGDPALARQEPVIQQTITSDQQASAAMRDGRIQDAVAIYRQIDVKGTEILAIAQQKLAPVTMKSTQIDIDQAQYLNLALGDLIKARRMIGLNYEHMGQDAVAVQWYEKAISTTGYDPISAVRLGFMYAWGRGVPQDRERAMALFGGNGKETFGNTLFGGRNEGESSLAYLLRKGELPRRPEDVTADYVARIEARDVNAHVAGLALFMAVVNAGHEEQTAAPSRGPGIIVCRYFKSLSPSTAGMAGCPPWTP